MFTSKPNLRRRNRAVTLIEAVLYISIALALIVGGLVFFQQASTAAKTSTLIRQLSATIAEARVVVKGIPLTASPYDITSYLISAGAVPPDMVTSSTGLSNPFGGSTVINATANPIPGQSALLSIILFDIPRTVCARLLTASSGSDYDGTAAGFTTAISSGLIASSVAPNPGIGLSRYYAMNPTQAGWMCKYGSNNYTNKAIEPTSSPISGNTTIFMLFLIDA